MIMELGDWGAWSMVGMVAGHFCHNWAAIWGSVGCCDVGYPDVQRECWDGDVQLSGRPFLRASYAYEADGTFWSLVRCLLTKSRLKEQQRF
ncbi:hypothetical protein Tco_0827581 [Tanacetum coccineum]